MGCSCLQFFALTSLYQQSTCNTPQLPASAPEASPPFTFLEDRPLASSLNSWNTSPFVRFIFLSSSHPDCKLLKDEVLSVLFMMEYTVLNTMSNTVDVWRSLDVNKWVNEQKHCYFRQVLPPLWTVAAPPTKWKNSNQDSGWIWLYDFANSKLAPHQRMLGILDLRLFLVER